MAELKPKRQGNYHHNGNPKHGLYNANKDLFNVWQTMKGRCENPNRPKKGIEYAEQRISEIA